MGVRIVSCVTRKIPCVQVQNASVCTGKTPACVQHAGVVPVLTGAELTHREGVSLSRSLFSRHHNHEI